MRALPDSVLDRSEDIEVPVHAGRREHQGDLSGRGGQAQETAEEPGTVPGADQDRQAAGVRVPAPEMRLRDIAASLDITERSAFGIVSDLVEGGYVVKEKDGRRNRYHIQAHLPRPEAVARERTVGEVLALLVGAEGS